MSAAFKLPNPASCFTEQQKFAYRLREGMFAAFRAGARYGAKNPAVMEQKLVLATLEELAELPDFVPDEFGAWAAGRHCQIGSAFGLGPDVLDCYFKEPL
mgnify:CR=1 FL=1